MTDNGRGVLTFKADTHAYAIDGEPALSVTQVLELGGLKPPYDGVDPAVLEYARERGEKADYAADLYDQGVLDETSLDDTLRPYVAAWKAFRAKEPFVPDAAAKLNGDWTCQRAVWWKPLKIAGRLDRIGVWGPAIGRRCIVDIKCVSRTHWSYGVQLAGYTALHLLGEGVPLGKQLTEAVAGVERKVVNLQKTGKYQVESYTDPEDLVLFLACVHLARATVAHGEKR